MWLNSRMRQYVKSKKASFKYEVVSKKSIKRKEKMNPVERKNTIRQDQKKKKCKSQLQKA